MMRVFDIISSWISLLPRITLSNIFEIAIIAYLVYEILFWIKNTRAWVLLKGLIIIFAFTLLAAIFRFDTILWILGKIATIAVTALIIIFQPELRRALEQLGSKNILTTFFTGTQESVGFSSKTIDEITKAVFEMARVRTGALVVIERKESLKDIERTGIEIGAITTSQLLINIFEHNTPLHDGAVIIRGNYIVAATCYLPLSDNRDISKALGTRHRAAMGISEVTDSITLVVSEETGRVSLAIGGKLERISDAAKLREILSSITQEPVQINRFKLWRRILKNERKAD